MVAGRHPRPSRIHHGNSLGSVHADVSAPVGPVGALAASRGGAGRLWSCLPARSSCCGVASKAGFAAADPKHRQQQNTSSHRQGHPPRSGVVRLGLPRIGAKPRTAQRPSPRRGLIGVPCGRAPRQRPGSSWLDPCPAPESGSQTGSQCAAERLRGGGHILTAGLGLGHPLHQGTANDGAIGAPAPHLGDLPLA
jgi:hypothetical protein